MPALLVVACVLAAAAVSMYYAVRVNTWAVMTDELQVARLATSIAQSLSPIPTIRGEYYGAHSQLYPLLLAPFYGLLSAPAAASAAHALNALLLASSAVPAFLLARSVSGRAVAGYAAAALTAVTPWLVLSSTLLTENAAYPAFAWSLLLCHRMLVRPSARRDAAALAGLVLAFLGRTQLFVLVLALPCALLLHEIGYAALRRRNAAATRSAASGAIRRHRVLAGVYGAGILLAGALVTLGALGGLVGNYALPFRGDLLPAGFWGSAAAHLDQVAVGVGVVPVVLSVSWVVTTLVLPERREAHAFAALFVVLVPLLLFEVTSFDLRFTPGQFIQDRYLVYLVPLFAVGCAAWLAGPLRHRAATKVVTATAAAAAFVALLRLAPNDDTVIFWAAPGAAFRPAIADAASWLQLSDTVFLQTAAAAAVLAVLAAAWRAPKAAFATTVAALTAFGAFQLVYVLEQDVAPAMITASAGQRDWIDRAVPDGDPVALVPGGTDGPVAWWEAELWNTDVERELRVDRGATFTPFPVLEASIDTRRGRLVAPQPSDYLVVAESEHRFGLAEPAVIAAQSSLRLVRVRRPYRLAWSARGLTTDGWVLPGRSATIRVYGHPGSGRRAVGLTFSAPRRAERPVGFAITAQGDSADGTVDPGGARSPVVITVCVPSGGHSDVRVSSRRGAPLDDGRVVSVHVDHVAVSTPWPCGAM